MFKNKVIKTSLIFILTIFLISTFLNIFNFNLNIKNYTFASLEDINYAINNKIFGSLYTLKIDENYVHASKTNNNLTKLDVKFLNLITLSSIMVDTKNEYVYAGGNAVGIYLNTKGAVLMGSNSIITENGLIDTLKDSDLQVGDLILEINDEEINNIEDITEIINREDYNGEKIKITYQRKDKIYSTYITPVKDIQSNTYKIGIWVKNDTTGVGTLTYVKPDGRFGALGHQISDSSKNSYSIQNGKIYNCNIIGVQKGKKGHPGELKGLFLQGKNSQGEIDKNTNFGVFGNLNEDSSLFESAKERKYLIGGRLSARPGKAKILSCVDGTEVKEYDIEIIKANYQNTSKEKSLVIKVTDKELLEKTGGIVQGMSGSPIIQNGKIIGAVTHVFINDATKGYGIYLDWMVNN